jgi:hypothetical protein
LTAASREARWAGVSFGRFGFAACFFGAGVGFGWAKVSGGSVPPPSRVTMRTTVTPTASSTAVASSPITRAKPLATRPRGRFDGRAAA